MKIEVTRYLKPDGYPSRYWAVMVDGDLLAVTVYRKGAEAVADALSGSGSRHLIDSRRPPVDSVSDGDGR